MTDQATPRPWLLDTLEGGGWAVVVEQSPTGAKVIAELDDTTGNRGANAALIVRAVNAYDDLVKALQAARCDHIVNNGMGEPTECGRTLPCEYHDPERTTAMTDIRRRYVYPTIRFLGWITRRHVSGAYCWCVTR